MQAWCGQPKSTIANRLQPVAVASKSEAPGLASPWATVQAKQSKLWRSRLVCSHFKQVIAPQLRVDNRPGRSATASQAVPCLPVPKIILGTPHNVVKQVAGTGNLKCCLPEPDWLYTQFGNSSMWHVGLTGVCRKIHQLPLLARLASFSTCSNCK